MASHHCPYEVYDGEDLLTEVDDAVHGTLTIARATDGTPTALITAAGRTELTIEVADNACVLVLSPLDGMRYRTMPVVDATIRPSRWIIFGGCRRQRPRGLGTATAEGVGADGNGRGGWGRRQRPRGLGT